MSWVKLKLPYGTLKLKPARHLRRREREGEVPMLKIGPGYLVWTANARNSPQPGEPAPGRNSSPAQTGNTPSGNPPPDSPHKK